MEISTTLYFETMPLLSLMHCPDFGDTLRLAAAAVVAESKDEGALMSGQSMRRWVCFELLRREQRFGKALFEVQNTS